MPLMTRRDFIKLGGLLAAAAGMGEHATLFAQGLERLAKGAIKVLWIQAQSCSGCSVSLLNTDSPDVLELLTNYISLVFHQTVGAAQGDTVTQILEGTLKEKPRYVLAIEGAIPFGMPEACVMAGKPLTEILPGLIANAAYVMGIGTCAAYGGIPAAEGNPTGAVSVLEFMRKIGMKPEGKLVNCPLCPDHPESMIGTMAYLAGKGYPKVNPNFLTPDMFFSRSTHDDCPRYHNYTKHIFAQKFGDDGCLFKLGCVGALAHTECPRRQWNGGVNWCVRASAPCLACSNEDFARKKDFPFYRKSEKYRFVAYDEAARKGGVVQ